MSAPVCRAYQPGDETAINELFLAQFGWPRSIEEWRWRFREGPAGPATIMVLTCGPEIVGHVGYEMHEGFIRGERARFALGGDLMIAPEHRGRGAANSLVEGFLTSDHGADGRIGFPTDRAVHVLKRHRRVDHLGRVPHWVRWHSGAAFEQSIGRRLGAPARTLIGVGLAWAAAAARHPRGSVRVAPLTDLASEIDDLADDSASFAPCIRRRHVAYLRWRWLDRPDGSSQVLGARTADGRLGGWAVLRAGPDAAGHGVAVGCIVDLLARDAATTRALLVAAADTLRVQGAARVTLEYQDPRPWARRACFRAGFVRSPGPNVISRSLSPRAGGLCESLPNWYLTLGDTDLC